MKKLGFLICFTLCLGVLAFWYASSRIMAVEQLGELYVRGLSQEDLFGVIDRYENEKRVAIFLPGTEKVYSLKELGVEIDKGELWYERNSLTSLSGSNFPKMRIIKSNLLVEPKSGTEAVVAFNESTGLFEIKSRKQVYKVEMREVFEEVVREYGKTEIKIAPKYEMVEDESLVYLSLNESLKQIYRDPLTLKVKDGGDFVDYLIPKDRLIKSISIENLNTGSEVVLDKGILLEEVFSRLTTNQRKYFDENIAFENLRAEVNRRFKEGKTMAAVLGIDDGPTTSGELANKYLEVDISQQKMYFFIDNKLFKEYKVSTGNYYPTPIGRYSILNKAKNAYSEIFGVWMPYWMAFEYAEDIGAYLGIHELPYVSYGGERLYRFGYYIGNKMTGGCVAMEPKDSKEVFELSDVGMVVNVVP